ncbi:hypothetical protein OF83DRAFT_1055743 [Amylostereum chailletii]|nr:hypothetical protein OF83DRAFT_1055743 [Amylostereum chailletii]
MADTTSTDIRTPSPSSVGPIRTAAPALQRGRACLRCRKRKMRCDGTKPACQNCLKAKKGSVCEYDDGKGKTRTQILRENIARLEARVKELEGPDRAASSVTLFDPHAFDESSSSSAGSPPSLPFLPSASPYPFSASPTPSIATPPLPWLASVSEPPAVASSRTQSFLHQETSSPDSPVRASMTEFVPLELAQTLLDIFLPHAQQVGFDCHAERLRNSLHLPMEEQRHPALMNAIYLWACFLSRPQSLSQHEPLYLTRATEAFNDALQHMSKLVDVVQACCLLSLYMLTNGRLAEGSYYSSTAATLATQWGLHRRSSEQLDNALCLDPSFILPPAQDVIEEGERVLAFWQVFNIDRCWSVLLQRPPTFADGQDVVSGITVPWPQDMAEYETGNLNSLTDISTVQTFLVHQSQVAGLPGGFSNAALRAKASALFDAAVKISTSWSSRKFAFDTQSLETTITRFAASLLPLHQLNAVRSTDKHTLLAVHTLAQAALIQLHYRHGATDALRHETSLHAAKACVFVIRHIGDADFDYLDPVMGSCWAAAASVFVRETSRVEAWAAVTSSESRVHVGTILAAMSKLSLRFPLIGESAPAFL